MCCVVLGTIKYADRLICGGGEGAEAANEALFVLDFEFGSARHFGCYGTTSLFIGVLQLFQ
jgi:hypothetical protein